MKIIGYNQSDVSSMIDLVDSAVDALKEAEKKVAEKFEKSDNIYFYMNAATFYLENARKLLTKETE